MENLFTVNMSRKIIIVHINYSLLKHEKGVITQGLDGYHDRQDAKRWTKEFKVAYEHSQDGEMTTLLGELQYN